LGEWIATWWASVWQLLAESAPWLLAGFALAGVVHVALPVDKLTKHLGRPGLGSVIKAALIGVPLPLCSCSVIPVASSIRKQGASKGAFLSFVISTPETGADSIAISYALLGPVLAVVRPIAAAITAIAAGLLADASVTDVAPPQTDASSSGAPDSSQAEGSCCTSGCGCSSEPASPRKWTAALYYGFVEMFADLAIWLVVGFALAGLASALVPDGFIEGHIGSGLGAMLLMLAVGMPLYVCATSSTPIAAALIAKGLSPGAALVFLLAGPATNLATMVIVARDAGKRGVVIYLATIAVVAVGVGLLLDTLNGVAVSSAVTAAPGAPGCECGLTETVSAVILLLLIANGLRIAMMERLRKRRVASTP